MGALLAYERKIYRLWLVNKGSTGFTSRHPKMFIYLFFFCFPKQPCYTSKPRKGKLEKTSKPKPRVSTYAEKFSISLLVAFSRESMEEEDIEEQEEEEEVPILPLIMFLVFIISSFAEIGRRPEI